jgi:hypothetical protein
VCGSLKAKRTIPMNRPPDENSTVSLRLLGHRAVLPEITPYYIQEPAMSPFPSLDLGNSWADCKPRLIASKV